jgi:diguanylate cyclase (GGDEF)-like protein
MKHWVEFLGSRSRRTIWLIATTTTLVIGAIDLIIGYEYSTSLFYVIPVAIATWYGSRTAGVVIALLSAIVWLAADIGAGHEYSHVGIFFWNTLIRFGVLLVIVMTLAGFRRAVRQVERAAATDYLTGLLNRRGFYRVLAQEHARGVRYGRPFTLAYLDLDNFKSVNDRFGHDTGDKLLIGVAQRLDRMLRQTDRVARLGGDEFAVLFAETGSSAARAAFMHTHAELMAYMKSHDWPVTFSVGMVTFETVPATTEQTLKVADEVMYDVKRGGKDNIVSQVWPGCSRH